MPLTATQRSQLYRQKLKEAGGESLAKYLMKDAQRKRRERAERSEEQKRLDQLKTNDRVAAFRATKLNQRLQAQTQPQPKGGAGILRAYAGAYTRTTAYQNLAGPYASQRSLSRAVSKSKRSLPESPTKAEEVVKSLAAQYGLIKRQRRSAGHESEAQEVAQAVSEYYTRDDVSRQAPGHRDFITIRSAGKKEQIQKRHMIMTIQEAYALFKEENEALKCGKSKFAELRPQHVLSMSKIPENVCCCQIHENGNFILSALKSAVKEFPGDHKQLIESLGCDVSSGDCMSATCEICKDKFAELQESIPSDKAQETITVRQWEKNAEGMIGRSTKKMTVTETLVQLEATYQKLLTHCFVKTHQATHFNRLVNAVTLRNIVLQVDYSENFVIRHQDAIQSDHWAGVPVTIYTAVAWLPSGPISMAIMSDYDGHDKYATAVFNSWIISHLQSLAGEDFTIDLFSDGAAQHFKQKYTLANMTTHAVPVNWHFFATSHGKGAVDGVGGTVKRAVHRAIMARRSEPTNAEELSKCASDICPGIKVKFISANTISEEKGGLDQKWLDVKSLTGLQCLHCIRTVSPFTVKVSQVSSDSEGYVFAFKSEENQRQETTASRRQLANVVKESVRSAKAEKKAFENAMKSFATAMSNRAMEVDVNIPADGNCLFWTISNQLDTTNHELESATHEQLRQKTADYIANLDQQEKDELQPFLDKPLEGYVRDLRQSGTYGDHVAVDYLSKALQCCIELYHLDSKRDVALGDPLASHLLVGYLPEVKHFVSLKRNIEFCSDNYYAVYYTEPQAFYIGRIADVACNCNAVQERHLKMFFLKRNYLRNTFSWPTRRSSECVSYRYAFDGPVTLEGAGPFVVPSLKNIQKKFSGLKKMF